MRFERCWQTLANLKIRSSVERDQLLDFQPTLAGALFNLEKMCRSIRAEERRLVARKRQVSDVWFRTRMKTLRRYRVGLREAMDVGRGIGDAFAWLFYYRQPEYLIKHLGHQPLKSMPPGIGGRGELAFLHETKLIGKSLVIYHGTTTFLRIGDISLINLESGRLAGIGELKTTESEPGKFIITIHLVGPGLLRILPGDVLTKTRSNSPPLNKLPESIRQRLDRQLNAMGATFAAQKPEEVKDISRASHLPELCTLAQKLEKENIAFQRVGDGLLLIGHRQRGKGDFARRVLSRTRQYRSKRHVEELKKHVLGLMGPNSDDNSVILGALDLTLLPGATPLFWWRVDLGFLRSLFFQDTVVVCVYNPAHLAHKFRAAGFHVERLKDNWEIRVSKQLSKGRFVLDGFNYFAQMVSRHLMREEAVVIALEAALKKAEDQKSNNNLRIDIQMMLNWM